MGTPWVSFDGKDCSGCKHLNERGYCEFTACIIPCTVRATIPEVKPQTNADHIRAMTDDELATWINHMQADAYGHGIMETAIVNYPNTYSNWLEWLRKDVDT